VLLLNPFAWFWIPLGIALVLAVALLFMTSPTSLARLSRAAIGSVAVSVLATAFWCWFFKDGLGPGFVPSSGLESWRRFGELLWVPLAIAAFVTVLIVGIRRWREVVLNAGSLRHAK
jgi:hypothetical protein